tara:strand:- start:3460 stop:3669 length:210 start_codon:yes stop_codon:yes gene_type:complete
MNVIFSVGVTMVSAVMGCPPQRSALSGTACNECTDELNYSRCLESPVRKIPVIKGGYAKHSDGVGNKSE